MTRLVKCFLFHGSFAAGCLLAAMATFTACSSIELVESPKTAFVPENAEAKRPAIIWTSRTMTTNFDYLGVVKARSWNYEGALERLLEGGRQMKADAIVDIHFEAVGFLSTMQAFAVKFR